MDWIFFDVHRQQLKCKKSELQRNFARIETIDMQSWIEKKKTDENEIDFAFHWRFVVAGIIGNRHLQRKHNNEMKMNTFVLFFHFHVRNNKYTKII